MVALEVPPQWRQLGAGDLDGTVMILGASDTGKSTLARYLFRELSRQGRRPAFLDTDVGQSTLGLPTTMMVALAGEAGEARFPPEGARRGFFVGSTTPRGHMLPAVIGAYRLRQWALAQGAGAVVVDTTGLVDRQEGGKALKEWKIELLAPGTVIALQRGRELEPILWPLRRDGRVRCIEVGVSPRAVARSREARIAWRRERLAAYFAQAGPHLLDLRTWAVYDVEEMAVGALLALQDTDGFAVDLGVVERLDRLAGTATIRTPRTSLEGVISVRFGRARWDWARQGEA